MIFLIRSAMYICIPCKETQDNYFFKSFLKIIRHLSLVFCRILRCFYYLFVQFVKLVARYNLARLKTHMIQTYANDLNHTGAAFLKRSVGVRNEWPLLCLRLSEGEAAIIITFHRSTSNVPAINWVADGCLHFNTDKALLSFGICIKRIIHLMI